MYDVKTINIAEWMKTRLVEIGRCASTPSIHLWIFQICVRKISIAIKLLITALFGITFSNAYSRELNIIFI